VPQVGTVLGSTPCLDHTLQPSDDPRECPINSDYKPWVSTPEAETTILCPRDANGNCLPGMWNTVAQSLRNAVNNSVGGNTLGFRLAQDLNGDDVVVGRTYTNVGRVDTQGVDFGLQYFITPRMSVQVNYSWFDFKIVEAGPGLEDLINTDDLEEIQDILLPNTPAHKTSLAYTFAQPKWDIGAAGRWVKGFRWSAGIFQGDVPDYYTVDVWGSYKFNDLIRIGANIANATDNVHRQTFGGDLLTRRALLYLTFSW
jgi:outer membrane receptor protein involved in Fe transport